MCLLTFCIFVAFVGFHCYYVIIIRIEFFYRKKYVITFDEMYILPKVLLSNFRDNICSGLNKGKHYLERI